MSIMIYETKGFWARSYGWHCFATQHPQHWLFLSRCQAVHSIGLSVSLWVLFVDRNGRALGCWHFLKPYRFCWHRGAYGVIETAMCSHQKRHRLQVALLERGWLQRTTPWEVGCFGQKYYEK